MAKAMTSKPTIFSSSMREIAGDHAGLLQRAHAPQAGRRRDADLARELDVGDAAVGLQFLEDAPIGSIEAGAHGAMTPRERWRRVWRS